jgi:hypothetical protein
LCRSKVHQDIVNRAKEFCYEIEMRLAFSAHKILN